MTTHELETMLGLPKQTIHYYEKEGLIQPNRDENNYRNYSQNDIDVLKLVQLLRSMDISIDEIKQILNNELSIRKALETKQEFIQKSKIELENIDQRIKEYVKRRKVKVVFEIPTKKQDALYCYDDVLEHEDTVIHKADIESIDISMCSSIAFMRGLAVFFNYYVDFDIHTKQNTYSFQIMNNDEVNELFEYVKDCHCHDPLNLVSLYREKKDPVMLNKYLDNHFKVWAKEYHLDNPRENYIFHDSFHTSSQEKDRFGLKKLKELFK